MAEVFSHYLLNGVKRQPHNGGILVSCCCSEHHKHGLPARLDVVDTSQDHLTHTSDDQFTDLNGLQSGVANQHDYDGHQSYIDHMMYPSGIEDLSGDTQATGV